jgi:peptidylprolyl isomerase
VGTAKRERQKANRQLRLEELAKQARKQKTKRFSIRVVGLLVAVVAVVGGLYLISGGDDDEAAATTTSTTLPEFVTTTIDPNLPTTTVPPRPEVVLPEGEVTALLVTTITEGTGELSKAGDTLDVHYLGYLSGDGEEFDNSYDRGAPIQVVLGAGQVIEGWDQGLIGVQVGGRYRIDIPSELAYGDDAAASGRPAGPLTFIVDIMSIKPGV